MKMKTFSEYMLSEIGDSSEKYPYRILQKLDTKYKMVARFKTATYDYEILWEYLGTVTTLTVSFRVINKYGNISWNATNAGISDAFKIVSTVIEATKEKIKTLYRKNDIKIRTVSFSGVDLSKSGEQPSAKKSDQRVALYLAFLKKQFGMGDIKILKHNGTTVVDVKIPDSFYD